MPNLLGDSAITTSVSPDRSRATIKLTGDLDISSRPQLGEVIMLLRRTSPRVVTIDLTTLTFAGSVLPNFLAEICRDVRSVSTLIVDRPTPMAHLVLQITGMTKVATITHPPDRESMRSLRRRARRDTTLQFGVT